MVKRKRNTKWRQSCQSSPPQTSVAKVQRPQNLPCHPLLPLNTHPEGTPRLPHKQEKGYAMMGRGDYDYLEYVNREVIISSVTYTDPQIFLSQFHHNLDGEYCANSRGYINSFPSICQTQNSKTMIEVLALKEIATQQLVKRGCDPLQELH